MATYQRPGSRYWQLPDGVIAYQCVNRNCMEIATIVVQRVKEIDTPLCHNDWHALQRQTHGQKTEIVRTLEPRCVFETAAATRLSPSWSTWTAPRFRCAGGTGMT